MTGLIHTVVLALCLIESGNNPRAIGDSGRAVGVLQMWPIAVQEANRLNPKAHWTMRDRSNPVKAKAMATAILAQHYAKGIRDPVELGCRWRNPNGDAPTWYREKVKKALKKKRR